MTDAMFLVLIVEDDRSIRTVLRTLLESRGYRVVEAETAARGLIEARNHRPDLIIVDLGLPDRDGLTLIRDVRTTSSTPILVLSARTLETDKVLALDAGADDYVAKPFSTPELLARVRAALRRNSRGRDSANVLNFGPVSVDLTRRTAIGPQGSLHLTPLEYRLLDCLARQAGLIVTQAQLIREVWGPDRQGDSRGLRTYVRLLRRKLEPDPARPTHLLTEVGVGYRLVVADEGATQPGAQGPDGA